MLNADPHRADTNKHSHSSPAEVMQALRDRLSDKYRKDAVISLEYFAFDRWNNLLFGTGLEGRFGPEAGGPCLC
jgi:hypothetical protein